MLPSEWLRKALPDGSNEISPSVRLLHSHFVEQDSETLWTAMGLLAACFSDLASSGHINSLPANMDLKEAGRIFMHLSNIMATADARLNGHGNEPLDLRGSPISIPEEAL